MKGFVNAGMSFKEWGDARLFAFSALNPILDEGNEAEIVIKKEVGKTKRLVTKSRIIINPRRVGTYVAAIPEPGE